jgi:hypothetical protein
VERPEPPELLRNFAAEDRARVEILLDALLPCLDLKRTVFVGGIATRYAAWGHGISAVDRRINDIDAVVDAIDAVSTHITGELRIPHSHIMEGGLPYFAVVHPPARLKADLFGRSGLPLHPVTATYKARALSLAPAADQLVADLRAVAHQVERRSISPKRFDSLRLLLTILPPEQAERAWHAACPDALTVAVVIARAARNVLSHPEWIRAHEFERPPGHVCAECVDIPGFPRTLLDEIRSMLDVVE